MEAVVGELFNAKAGRMRWCDASRYKQDDGCSCGVYLVENMFSHVNHSIPRKRPPSALELREAHLNLLEAREPRYYQTHVALAQDAAPVQAQRLG